jgi:Zn-dependent protease/predicted transcriptional regulator
MRSYTVTSVWGIPIRINISLIVFLPILAYLIGNGGQIEVYAGVIETLTGRGFDLEALRAGQMPWVIGITAATGLFVSVTLHELGHSWVALRYGLEIESITLWILGGLAALSEIPREWNREFWIAIAGPITSVLVGLFCYAGLLAIPESSQVIRFLVGWLAIVNLTLAVFNLLPAFPMDGGRILRALLARSRPYASATRIAGRIGVLFAVLFAVFGVFPQLNPIFLLLAWFIYSGATSESRSVLLDELLQNITVGDIMTRDPRPVEADTTLREFADRMIRDRQTVFPVTDGGDVIGAVSLADLKSARNVDRETTTVRSVMREVPRVDADADAFDTLAAYSSREGLLTLVTRDGSVAGVLSDADYSHALTVQRGFQSGLIR